MQRCGWFTKTPRGKTYHWFVNPRIWGKITDHEWLSFCKIGVDDVFNELEYDDTERTDLDNLLCKKCLDWKKTHPVSYNPYSLHDALKRQTERHNRMLNMAKAVIKDDKEMTQEKHHCTCSTGRKGRIGETAKISNKDKIKKTSLKQPCSCYTGKTVRTREK